MSEKEEVKDEQCIATWRAMLNLFHNLIEGNPKSGSIKTDLEELKEEAKNNAFLTGAQRAGIIDRCENYLNGSYGRNLSTAAH